MRWRRRLRRVVSDALTKYERRELATSMGLDHACEPGGTLLFEEDRDARRFCLALHELEGIVRAPRRLTPEQVAVEAT